MSLRVELKKEGIKGFSKAADKRILQSAGKSPENKERWLFCQLKTEALQ